MDSLTRRNARKKTLPNNFTNEEWLHCLTYWSDKCAYCEGRQNVLHQEHFIPLSKGGGYTATNIVPACKFCNTSKGNQEARKWAMKKFGKPTGKQIIDKILSYFDTIGEQLQVDPNHTWEGDLKCDSKRTWPVLKVDPETWAFLGMVARSKEQDELTIVRGALGKAHPALLQIFALTRQGTQDDNAE